MNRGPKDYEHWAQTKVHISFNAEQRDKKMVCAFFTCATRCESRASASVLHYVCRSCLNHFYNSLNFPELTAISLGNGAFANVSSVAGWTSTAVSTALACVRFHAADVAYRAQPLVAFDFAPRPASSCANELERGTWAAWV